MSSPQNGEEPAPTVPRTPIVPAQQTEDTKPRLLGESASDDTAPRVAGGSASEDPKRTADHASANSAARSATETVARTPGDVSRLEASAAEGVPGYVFLSELGKGGMGVVYKARHTKLNRVVALKMMLGGERASRNDTFRFLAEAEAVAAIRHENVVQVFDYGENDNKPFMALEFCPGGTLTKLLPKSNEQATQPREMAALIAQVARGVAAAHALGIIHRDLKPGNVFLDEAGVPKVADFGLAKRGEGADVTQAGVGMGTPAYMAPEQARDAKFVGPQADVWALGVMLYEALCGVRPFTGTVQEIMAQAQAAEPLAPRKHVPAVPLDLELICLKCLSKAPHERYATAKELGADLERFARGDAISVRPLGAGERVVRWVRRKPTLAAAYGFSALAVVLALATFFVFGLYREADTAKTQLAGANGELELKTKQAQDARADADKQRGIAEGRERDADRLRGLEEKAKNEAVVQKGIAEKAKAEAERLKGIAENAEKAVKVERDKLAKLEYGRKLQVAHQEWRDGNIPLARALLEQTNPKFRDWEWHYLHRLCNGSLVTLKGHDNSILHCKYNRAGTRIATCGHDLTTRLWDAKTGEFIFRLLGHDMPVNTVTFSPDGKNLLTSSWDKTARVWNAENAAILQVLKDHTDRVESAMYNEDGTKIVTASLDNTAKVWDAATGKVLFTIKDHERAVRYAEFSRDGKKILTVAGDVFIWDATDGTKLATIKGNTVYGFDNARFNRFANRVVTTHLREVHVWDVSDGSKVVSLAGHTDKVNTAEFSPDGALIVTASSDRTARVWDVKTGEELLVLRGHTHWVEHASFSPNGDRIVTVGADHLVHLWDAKVTSEYLSLPVISSHSAAFTADGGKIALGSSWPSIWDADTGKVLHTFVEGVRREDADYCGCALSPDGTRLVTCYWQNYAKLWDVTKPPDLRQIKRGQQYDLVGTFGKPLMRLDGHTDRVWRVAYRPDGKQFATASWDGTSKIWNAETGQDVRTLKGHTGKVRAIAYSPNGKLIATGGEDKTAKVWDADTGKELLTFRGHTESVLSVEFGPDSKRIVSGGEDRTVRVWDAASGDVIHTLEVHTNTVHAATFNPSGTRFASASTDRTIRIWDSESGAEVFVLKGHTHDIYTLAFGPDGKRLFSGGSSSRLWDSRPYNRDLLPKQPAPKP